MESIVSKERFDCLDIFSTFSDYKTLYLATKRSTNKPQPATDSFLKINRLPRPNRHINNNSTRSNRLLFRFVTLSLQNRYTHPHTSTPENITHSEWFHYRLIESLPRLLLAFLIEHDTDDYECADTEHADEHYQKEFHAAHGRLRVLNMFCKQKFELVSPFYVRN